MSGGGRLDMVKRWFGRLLAGLFLLCLLLTGGLWWFLHGSLAQLDGQANGHGLSALVTVTRDAAGVPSIAGQTRADIAFATGYLHAQERYFQMDLLRRVAAGELAELLGPVALPADRAHRYFRFRARADAALLQANDADRALLQRYSDGVNAGMAALSSAPPEYLLVARRPRPWTPADSLLVSWAIYLDLQGSLESSAWARGWLKDHTNAEQLAFLLPESSVWDAPLDAPSPDKTLLVPDQAPGWWRRPVSGKAASLAADPLPGSNNWALAGRRTRDGRAILANDMHLSLHLPPVWYRLLLDYPDEQGVARKVVGVSLPGTPVVVVGSNTHVAWGFTNVEGDWLDLIRLDQDPAHPGQVRIGDSWHSPTVALETIIVKGAAPEQLIVRETPLGPLRETDGQVYAVHWLAEAPEAVSLGLRALETAPNAAAALAIGAAAGIPALNMLAADDQGHIGWTVAGPMPDRARPGKAGFPLEPDPLAQSWQELLPPARHPLILDPADGQLQTANSRTLLGEGSAQIGDGGFDLGARTRQIRDDLAALGPGADNEAVYGVMLDDRALFIAGWRDRALAVLDDEATNGSPQRTEFKRLLQDSWDGHASTGSVGYRLARGFLHALYDECFATLNDSLAGLERGASYGGASARWPVVIDALLNAQPAAWLPAGRKDWRAVQLAAIDKTIASLSEGGGSLSEASWGRRNRANIAHHFAGLLPWLKPWLAAPADPLPGDSNMPRVAAPAFGPSERMVVAPGKEDAGIFNMPGGQSGHPLSPFFLAGHQDWVDAKMAPLNPGPAKYALVLTPG